MRKFTEIVFIDPAVSNISELLKGLRPGVQAVVLDAAVPAILQIVGAVRRFQNTDAVHIIAHGAPGEIRFSSGTIGRDDLAVYRNELSLLASVDEILLWSCETAKGQQGAAFVAALIEATGATVAAATGLVGHASLGGSWDLDVATPAFIHRPPLTAEAAAHYQSVMATFNTTTGIDNINGSGGQQDTINVAVGTLQAGDTLNGGGGTDTIVLTSVSGAYDFSVLGVGLSSIEVLTGSSGADNVTFTGTQLNGFSTINLNGGIDTLNITSTSTGLNGLSNGSLTGVEAVAAAGGGAVNINLTNQSESFSITGGGAADTLTGGSGNDTISGGGGNDVINGGAGAGDVAALGGSWLDYTITQNVDGSYTFVDNRAGSPGGADTMSNVELVSFNGGTGINIATLLNDAPVGVDDSNGGDAVSETGVTLGDATATGNVLSNDTDLDASLGDSKTVTGVRAGLESGVGSFSAAGATITGTYGTLTINADGTFTYTLHNEFTATNGLAAGQVAFDIFTYRIADAKGLSDLAQLTISITGSNDAAVITGTTTAELTETDTALSTGGVLSASDVDSSAAFVAQTDVTGSNGYGTFSITADGTWTYTLNGAHDEFAAGVDYTDSIVVTTADGTSQALTVTIHGSNDAAVIAGTTAAALIESDIVQSTGGSLFASDPDSPANFIAQTGAAGSSGYGTFTIAADGTWTYTLNDAHDEFTAGVDYTDSILVATADGTSRLLTVTIHGTNDAAIIAGTSTAELSETEAAQSVGGTLSASDVDSSAAFIALSNVAGSHGYGTFSIATDGTWTYTLNGAHDEFEGGVDYTDSILVTTADGTTQLLTVTIHGTNDAATITGSSTTEITQGETALSAGGSLFISDPDSSSTFVEEVDAPGYNGYGTFSIAADGTWTYTLTDPHHEFIEGVDYFDSYLATAADGTTQLLSVTIHGINDAATITGTSTAELTETDAALSAGGNLVASDVDSSAAFVTQTDVTGSSGYGTFSIAADGTWTYTMNSAHDEFAAGVDYTDSILVATADGTTQLLTVTIHGTNDAAIISGSSTADLTESDAAQSAGGVLSVSDVDSPAVFVPQTGVAGNNGYGRFSITADGTWTYTLDSAHDEFAAGVDYTDSILVATVDGTTQLLTVTIHGSNDAAVITGSSVAELTENDVTQSTGGTLSASDVDSPAGFVEQNNAAGSNGYGTFSIAADGTWTYTLNSAHDEFAAGLDYTDSIVVATADGTTQILTVTIHGTNDAAVITGTSAAALTESDATQSTGGVLSASDVDSSASFVAQSNVTGSSGYGTFSIAADGTWTYTLNDAHNEFVDGVDYTDSIVVSTADGTTQLLIVTIHGTNDAAVITGASTAELTESDSVQATGGSLSVSDSDSSATVVAQTGVAGSSNYGTFSIAADGTWTYTLNGAHDEFVGGVDYTDSILVTTADGTTQLLTVTIHGSDDAAIASDDAFTVAEDGILGAGLNVFADNGAGADSDVDSSLNVTAVNGMAASVGNQIILASGALLTLNADGTFSYDPNHAFDGLAAAGSGAANISATETFTYTLNNGDTATVTITITGVDGNDDAGGTTSDDSINAGIGNDTVTALAGNDTIRGGSGADQLFGGDGDDVFVFESSDSATGEIIDGGLDADRLLVRATHTDLAAATIVSVEAFEFDAAVVGAKTVRLAANQIGTGLAGDAAIIGSAGSSDYVRIDMLSATSLDLSGFNFTSWNSAGPDNDRLYVFGDANAETITGSSMRDEIASKGGNDTLDGGSGVDILKGGFGNDVYIVDAQGEARELDGQGVDTVQSSVSYALGAFIEKLMLTGSANLNGSGNALANTLTGNSGNNILTGGLGRDILTGGLGVDRFDFNALAESGITATTRDVITDFNAGTNLTTIDRIDLWTIDANPLLAGNQAFKFVANGGAFTAVGQVHAVQSGGNTLIEINTDANFATAEMVIQLNGVTAANINAGDFIL